MLIVQTFCLFIVIDCFQPTIRIYDIPNDTFESDDDGDESSEEEDEDEDDDDEDEKADQEKSNKGKIFLS